MLYVYVMHIALASHSSICSHQIELGSSLACNFESWNVLIEEKEVNTFLSLF